MIPHLMGTERGVCEGHEEMRPFFREVGQRKPSLRSIIETGISRTGKADLGISPSKAGRRANGFRGIDGTERSGFDSTPRRVLGVARGKSDAGGRI